MKCARWISWTLLLLGSYALAADSASSRPAKKEENPHLWRPRTNSVTVFKNGLGFFMGEADVELRDGWCVAKEVPPAVFGTLAIYPHEKEQIVDVVGSGPGEVVEFDDRDASRDPAVKRARLESAKLLKVTLSYKHKTDDVKTASGKLVSVGTEYVVLENEGGNSFAVPVEGIEKMQILELPLRVHVAADGGKSPAKSKLGMAYLRKGVTWIPEYTLKVLDDSSAELTLRGTLVNEAEDMVHTDVHFVVGVPHFLHTEYLAPISVGQVIRTIGAAVAPREIQTQMMNRAALAQETQRGFDRVVSEQPVQPGGGDVNRVLGSLPQLESSAGSDFTVYTKKDLTLRRGEKAIVNLFVRKISYSHVYRWSPPGAMEHYLVLHNETDTAWTTGPCLAISGERPLTEELLKYTPKGGRGELQVTSAINVAHEKTEQEIDRKLKAHNPHHDVFFDLVTLQGDLKLKNFEKVPVGIIINCHVPGKPISASDDGRMTVNPDKLTLREREGKVSWKVQLKSGETKALSYRYERFVPSN